MMTKLYLKMPTMVPVGVVPEIITKVLTDSMTL